MEINVVRIYIRKYFTLVQFKSFLGLLYLGIHLHSPIDISKLCLQDYEG